VPGEPVGWVRRGAPVAALVAWSAWLLAQLLPAIRVGALEGAGLAGAGCVAKAVAIGVLPAVILALMLRRGAPDEARGTVTYAALAGAAMGAFGVELTCPMRDPVHLFVWHALPALTLVCAAGAIGYLVQSRVRGGR
jgi:hypothetical protein